MKQRTYYFDNAKFILIFLVVFGHLLRTFINDNEAIYALYKTIYSFHMPAFVLISGFFAKGMYKKGYIGKLFKKLIIPYLIFQGIYSIYYYFLRAESSIVIDPLLPHWSLWFLISLFFWNVMVLGFSKLKPAYGMMIAIVIGLVVGYFDVISNYLSLSRTFVFFPMFLAGYYISKPNLNHLFTTRFRLISLVIFTLVLSGFYLYPGVDYQWLLGSKPYSEMLSAPATLGAMLTRFGFYLLSFMMIACFLSLIPRGKYIFTPLGQRTLYVYLLHGFFIQFFRESGLSAYFTESENYLMLLAFAILLTMLLSSRFVFSLAQPVIELNTTRFKMLMIKIKATITYYLSGNRQTN